MRRPWYSLTDDEAARLNPPDGVIVDEVAFYDAWLPVGVVPRPRTRLGWFVYHVLHGMLMRYPVHKVFGYALANTQPEMLNMSDAAYTRLGGAGVFTMLASEDITVGALVGYMVARDDEGNVVVKLGNLGEGD